VVVGTVRASADTVGTNVCSSVVGTIDYFTGVETGTLSGCHQQGSGTFVQSIDPNNPYGQVAGTIYWATGNATSHVITTSVPDSSVPCPAGFAYGTDFFITVVNGAYAGSTGYGADCSDVSRFPIIHDTNVGPVVI
jgi:hypothetical protein